MLACTKVFEAMRELDGMVEISSFVLAVAASFPMASNLLAQLVDQVCEAFSAIDLRDPSIVGWPPRHGLQRHLRGFPSTRLRRASSKVAHNVWGRVVALVERGLEVAVAETS
jgi:hypothetical protein